MGLVTQNDPYFLVTFGDLGPLTFSVLCGTGGMLNLQMKHHISVFLAGREDRVWVVAYQNG